MIGADTGWLDEEALSLLDGCWMCARKGDNIAGWLLFDWTGTAGAEFLDAELRGIIFPAWMDVPRRGDTATG